MWSYREDPPMAAVIEKRTPGEGVERLTTPPQRRNLQYLSST